MEIVFSKQTCVLDMYVWAGKEESIQILNRNYKNTFSELKL